jgi:hypothetical protein
MRISTLLQVLAALMLGMLVGCTSSNPNKQSFWQNFSFHRKTPPASSVAAAPAAPSFQGAPTTAPTVVPGSPQTATTLAMQPGTNYPVTPYGDNSMPHSYGAASTGYANSGYAPAAAPPTAAYTPASTTAAGFSGPSYAPSYSANGSSTQQPSSAYDYSASNPSGSVVR